MSEYSDYSYQSDQSDQSDSFRNNPFSSTWKDPKIITLVKDAAERLADEYDTEKTEPKKMAAFKTIHNAIILIREDSAQVPDFMKRMKVYFEGDEDALAILDGFLRVAKKHLVPDKLELTYDDYRLISKGQYWAAADLEAGKSKDSGPVIHQDKPRKWDVVIHQDKDDKAGKAGNPNREVVLDDERYDDERYDDERYDDERYDDERYDDERYDDERYDMIQVAETLKRAVVLKHERYDMAEEAENPKREVVLHQERYDKAKGTEKPKREVVIHQERD